jgi:hypothetical protein
MLRRRIRAIAGLDSLSTWITYGRFTTTCICPQWSHVYKTGPEQIKLFPLPHTIGHCLQLLKSGKQLFQNWTQNTLSTLVWRWHVSNLPYTVDCRSSCVKNNKKLIKHRTSGTELAPVRRLQYDWPTYKARVSLLQGVRVALPVWPLFCTSRRDNTSIWSLKKWFVTQTNPSDEISTLSGWRGLWVPVTWELSRR